MSMKHEYEVGDEVWYKGESVVFDGHNRAVIGRFFYLDGESVRSGQLKYLSPYPPVKAVDGWAVVNEEGNVSHIYLHGDQPNTNSDGWKMFHNNKRLVKGRFIPDNDNS